MEHIATYSTPWRRILYLIKHHAKKTYGGSIMTNNAIQNF